MKSKKYRYPPEIGSFIKKKREEKGLTQQELADSIGMKSSQEIAQIESGKIALPSEYATDLTKVLNISYEEMRQKCTFYNEKLLQQTLKRK